MSQFNKPVMLPPQTRVSSFLSWRRAVVPFALLASALFSGSAMANQIVNGDFSAGNVGFTSPYTLVPANGTVSTVPGEYGLTTNPATGFTNGYSSYTDHTGDAAGLMLLVDGSVGNAWAETISVTPSTTYTFTGWVASADAENVAILNLAVNGFTSSSNFIAPTTAGVWTKWTQTLTTGSSATSLVLSIEDLNPASYSTGDDFSLDDLSLVAAGTTSATPEPSSLALAAVALVGLSAIKYRRFIIAAR